MQQVFIGCFHYLIIYYIIFEGDSNYSSDTTTQIAEMSKFPSKEHEDCNNEKEKLEVEENNTSEVNAPFYSGIYKCLLPALLYVFSR